MSDRERPRVLIVNADDLGRTPGINAGIFDAHRRGLVTSATMMVGFAAAAPAAREARALPRLGIGLHVTLSGSVPTLPAARVPTLVDPGGRFPAKPEWSAALAPAEVEAEVRHQLARFRELIGRLPTHLDSHHHSHRHPVVLAALIAVAHEHRLPVRASSTEVARELRRHGVATTDHFVERFFGGEATREVLVDIIETMEPGISELMCHPARIDDELRTGSGYVDERARELAVLTAPELRPLLAARGIRLAHFGDAFG